MKSLFRKRVFLLVLFFSNISRGQVLEKRHNYIVQDVIGGQNKYILFTSKSLDQNKLFEELNRNGLTLVNSKSETPLISGKQKLEIKSSTSESENLEHLIRKTFGDSVIEVVPVEDLYLSGNDWGTSN